MTPAEREADERNRADRRFTRLLMRAFKKFAALDDRERRLLVERRLARKNAGAHEAEGARGAREESRRSVEQQKRVGERPAGGDGPVEESTWDLLMRHVRADRAESGALGAREVSGRSGEEERERNATGDVVGRRRRKRKGKRAAYEDRSAGEETWDSGAEEPEAEEREESDVAEPEGREAEGAEGEERWERELDEVFLALASRTRRRMLDALYEERGQTVAQLARAVGRGHETVRKHVAVLERAGLVRSERRRGRRGQCYLDGTRLERLRWGWIGKF
ncbi:MAG: helix-turn-helix transcriptional regulator [Pirellulales bacterium]|nr:helix-turn-helix transcriptional regulator [Pirellulales bacterium]